MRDNPYGRFYTGYVACTAEVTSRSMLLDENMILTACSDGPQAKSSVR